MTKREKQPKKIRIKWVKSDVGAKEPHKRTIRALGFKRLQGEVVQVATPQVLGMVQSVRHMVEVSEVSGS
ncbi:50S ribosomal protein L30 [Candidatus Sumerlaeota bacterium]|nr:50S ribosomal protein L30 [Candidatus Sumerlaeota bacterium]